MNSPNVLKSAAAMGLGVALSRLLGLVRLQVFAIYFGAGSAMDAFNIAFRIPNLFRDLFGEGAMNSAMVPAFVRAREEQGERRAWRVAGLVFRCLFVAMGVVAVLGMIFAQELTGLYASAYKAIPGKFELTSDMVQIMFLFLPLVTLAAAYMGILNSCGRFFLPAFASALFNISSVASGIALSVLAPSYGIHPIIGMAVGVVIGGAVQAFCQLPSLYRVGYRWAGKGEQDPAWHKDPYLKKMLLMMAPAAIGMAATQVNILVNSILATSQEPGAVSWLNYAFRLSHFPIGIVGVSLGAASLPELSRLWVSDDVSKYRDTLSRSLRSLMAIQLPASAGLVFLGFPIIQLVFGYGSFYESDSRATAMALAGYGSGLAFYSMTKVLVPACYAMNRARLAVISSVATVGVTIALSLAMIGPFGFWGLAVATSLGAFFQSVFLIGVMRKHMRSKGVEWSLSPLLVTFGKVAGIAAAMGLGAQWLYGALNQMLPDLAGFSWMGSASIPVVRMVKVGAVIGSSLVFVWGAGRLLGVTEIVDVFNLVMKKLKKRG